MVILVGVVTARIGTTIFSTPSTNSAVVLPTSACSGRPPDRAYSYGVNDTLPPCPKCSSEFAYEMGALLVCPMCAHEWANEPDGETEPAETVVKDAFGTVLTDGDTVSVIKDLKFKGSQTAIKVGTKVRNIRLVDAVDGHDIDCKVDGFGSMQLKSSVVKKV